MKKKQKHETPDQIKRRMKLERLRKDLIAKFPELYNATFDSDKPALEDLTGQTVKLNQEKFEAWCKRDKEKVSELRKKWYAENKDKEFVAKKREIGDIYELEGVDGWTFSYYDIEKVEDLDGL